jgi:hypothetical protein
MHWCTISVAEATKLVQAKYPGVGIVQTRLAPPMCAVGQLCTFGGLEQPVFVVFDMADGSRRAMVVQCGGPTYTNGQLIQDRYCVPSTFDYPEIRG